MSTPLDSRGRLLSIASGAATGVVAWVVFTATRDYWPVWARLLVAAPVLTFGPGAGLTSRLLAPLPGFVRGVLALSFGVALAPMVAHALGAVGLVALFPYLSAALTGGVLASWRPARPVKSAGRRYRLAAIALVLVTAIMGAAAFAHRMTTSRSGITIYGEYDSYDLTYYAAIAAELSHTIPPASPFYAGRMLDHPFYPHLLLAMVHRFGGVPILDLYFRYAWPAFLALAVLVCFVFVESVSTPRAAFVAALLFGAGSNLAYLAAWFLHPPIWDDVIWSHNFQGAGAEVLLYGNWTPALVAMWAGLYAVQACRRSSPGWAVVAGAAFASTIFSKPWIFASVLAALAVVIVRWRRDRRVARRLLLVGVSMLAIGAPLLYRAMSFSADAQVTFVPAFLPIPLVMADRLGLREWFLARAGVLRLTGGAQAGLAAALALPLFLAGTLGSRIVGVAVFWRGIRGRAPDEPVWPLLAWTALAAFLASSFIVSVPYHESQQIHQFALFLFAPFAAQALDGWRKGRARPVAAVVVVALAVPGTLQYLHRKWTDTAHVIARASPGEITTASVLRGTAPERTILLHDHPNDPSLVGILSERRSVLGWAGYVRGNQPRQDDIDRFFQSDDAATAFDVLRTYRPTHVLEYASRDRLADEVRDRLELVSRVGEVTLYRVPEPLLRSLGPIPSSGNRPVSGVGARSMTPATSGSGR